MFSKDSGAEINQLWGQKPELYSSLSSEIWPSCFKKDLETPISPNCFKKPISKNIQLDVRSLYPSAQICKQPILNAVLLTAASEEDVYLLSQRKKIRKKGVLAINPVCQRVRKNNPKKRFLLPINNYKAPPHRFEEYYACRLFAQNKISPLLSQGYELVSIAGASYAGKSTKLIRSYLKFEGGTANICGFYPDLLAVLDCAELNKRKLILYYYHGLVFLVVIIILFITHVFSSHFFHGHSSDCHLAERGLDEQKRLKHEEQMKATHEYFNKWTSWRNELASKLPGVYRRLHVEIVEENSCDFPSHSAAKKRDDPSIKHDLLIEDILDIRFNNEAVPNLLSMKTFEKMLMAEDSRGNDPKSGKPLLFNDAMNSLPGNTFQGFLVVRGGALSEESRHPSMGFCIQRLDPGEYLSDFTRAVHKENNIPTHSTPRIVGGHSYKGIHVLHTATYQYLSHHFGWSKKPEILHAVIFKSEVYEADIVTKLLLERKKVIKSLGDCDADEIQPLSNRKTVIKYILNGSKKTFN